MGKAIMSPDTLVKGPGVAFTDEVAYRVSAAAAGDASPDQRVSELRRESPDWLDERLEQVERLLELEANWNSYGANPIAFDSVVRAQALLLALARIEDVESPTVTASPDGNVAFCWDYDRGSLDVEVLPDGVFQFAYINESDSSRDEDGTTVDAGRLAVLLTQR